MLPNIRCSRPELNRRKKGGEAFSIQPSALGIQLNQTVWIAFKRRMPMSIPARLMNDVLHLLQISLQRTAALRSNPVFGSGNTFLE